MTTVQTWVDRARAYLQGSQSDAVNRLASAYYPGDNEIELEFALQGIGQGATLGAGRNCFLAWESDSTAKTVTVQAGWLGAADVPVAAGTVVRIKPKFFDHMLFDAIAETLQELTSPDVGLFAVDQIEIDWVPSQTVYDLIDADGYIGPLAVMFANTADTTDRWPHLRANQYEIRTIQPTTEFPSGLQLRLHSVPELADGQTIVLTYKKALTMPGDLDSNVETCGLDEAAFDIPPMGAAVRLAFPQEMRRNSTSSQGDTRRAEEVPAGANLGGARALLALYNRRVQQEYARLIATHHIRER